MSTAGLDMQAVREAMNRRLSGQAPGAILDQTTGGQMPSPMAGAPSMGGGAQQMPTQPATPPAAKQPSNSAQKATGGSFDDGTRETAKMLIQRLMKVL